MLDTTQVKLHEGKRYCTAVFHGGFICEYPLVKFSSNPKG